MSSSNAIRMTMEYYFEADLTRDKFEAVLGTRHKRSFIIMYANKIHMGLRVSYTIHT